MYTLFVISLLGLCTAALASFIACYRRRSLLLVVFVPLIALCGSFLYFSYTSVAGYPVDLGWNELPEKITVIYFRVKPQQSITVWLFDGDKTRLIRLPWLKPAEDGLEAQRGKMGKGIPVTFKRAGGGQGGEGEPGEGEGGEGNGQGRGRRGQGRPGDGQGQGGGWQYKVESFGEFIPGGSMPPK